MYDIKLFMQASTIHANLYFRPSLTIMASPSLGLHNASYQKLNTTRGTYSPVPALNEVCITWHVPITFVTDVNILSLVK